MPGLITRIDGIHAILFHVEHSEGEPWQYRWRLAGSHPAPYLVWRTQTTTEQWVRIVSEVRASVLEVEWRPDDSSEWLEVDGWRLKVPEAEFQIEALEDFSAAAPFIVCAPSRMGGVAAYRLPAVTLAEGESIVLNGISDAAAWSNVLLEAECFLPEVKQLDIRNTGPCLDWYELLPDGGVFQLCACPVATARKWFAIGKHAVSPVLLKSLTIQPDPSSIP